MVKAAMLPMSMPKVWVEGLREGWGECVCEFFVVCRCGADGINVCI